MISSVVIDADWSIVFRLPDALNMPIVQYVNMNGRQSNINLSIFSIINEWTIDRTMTFL